MDTTPQDVNSSTGRGGAETRSAGSVDRRRNAPGQLVEATRVHHRRSRRITRGLAVTLTLVLAASSLMLAQGPPAGGRGAPPPPRSPREAAPVDFTGYWVSVVTEDWRWRMVTPAKGDFAGVPLNAAARKIGQAWDPAKDEADGAQCKAYGAAAIMRVPGRLHITWQDDKTLRIDTDAGTQSRLLNFGGTPPPGTKPSWQGYSSAQWEGPARGPGPPDFLPIALNPREGTRGRTLEVVTNNLRAGYLRKNGVPYSERTTVREYFVLSQERNKDIWFVVTTIVEDPQSLTTPFVTSTNFKKQADATGWNPTPCLTR